MLLKELFESAITKAGIIPYIITQKGTEMMFMISSDPSFGGDKPMISKGHIDQGETPLQAAIREGEEELGLMRSNFKSTPVLIDNFSLDGMTATYKMAIYAVEVKTKEQFSTPHYETERVVWYTEEEFKQHGRSSHFFIVKRTGDVINEN